VVVVTPDPERPDRTFKLYPPDHPVSVSGDALCDAGCTRFELLKREGVDAILLAVIEAEPDGREAPLAAEVDTYRRIAIAGGWDDQLT
jgi:hypothetical protein